MIPSITETLFAVGAGERVVGVSEYCDYPEATSALPRVGSFVSPVAEVIVSLEPDLVLTAPSPGNKSAVRAIERAGIVVEVLYGDGAIEDVRRSIERAAERVGEAEAGRALLASMDRGLEKVRGRVQGRARPRTAVVVGHEPLVLAGPDSYLGELVAIAGGDNVAATVGGRWPRVGWEFLVEAAPEVIVDVSMSGRVPPDTATVKRRWERYAALPAVASGRVHGHTSFVLLRPGPRLPEAASVMVGLLHPELD